MRIVYQSVVPWAATGYGIQSAALLKRLQRDHDVAVVAQVGMLPGATLNWQGMPVYSAGDYGRYDALAVGQYCATLFAQPADLLITCFDTWIYSTYATSGLPCPWLAWVPVDSKPVYPTLQRALSACTYPVAMSRWGQEVLAQAQIHAEYVPLGVECSVFTPEAPPGEREETRRRLGAKENTFLVGFVGTNLHYPERKGIEELLLAVARFVSEHKEVPILVYLHTNPLPADEGGIDVIGLAELLGLKGRVTFPNRFSLLRGLPQEFMARLYRAFDVLVLPSHTEGFGLPVIEAQACGTPVIATAWGPLCEINAGYKISVLHLEFRPGPTWWAKPDDMHLAELLAQAWAERGDEKRRQEAIALAAQYDWERVYTKYWQPLLARIAEEQRHERAKAWRAGSRVVRVGSTRHLEESPRAPKRK